MHWFGVVISASEHDVVRWCQPYDLAASSEFWARDRERERESIGTPRAQLYVPVDGLPVRRGVGFRPTVDGVRHSSKGYRGALGFLEDEDE